MILALVSTLVGWAKVLRLPVMKSSEERASPWPPAPAASGGNGTDPSGWAPRPGSCWPCTPGTRRRCSGQDGFLLGGNTSGAHQLFEQGEDELGFLNQRVALIPIGFVHVQRIDVGIGRGRHPDHLAAQRFRQEAKFRFGVRMRISSSVDRAMLTISSLAEKDLPDPLTPKRKLFPLRSLRRSATIMFLETAFCP